VNVKRVAFETEPVTGKRHVAPARRTPAAAGRPAADWIATVEARLRDRAGNPPSRTPAPTTEEAVPAETVDLPLSEAEIEALVKEYARPGSV